MVTRMASALRRIGRWGERGLIELYGIGVPPCSDDEQVVRDGVAGLLRGVFGNRGRLLLTTHRLIFMSMQPPSMPRRSILHPRIEIDLREIKRLEGRHWLRRFWSPLPGFPLLTVTLDQSNCYTFQVKDADKWHRDIEQLRRGEGVRGMRLARHTRRR